jgi:alpha-1,2-glucosyltransferase
MKRVFLVRCTVPILRLTNCVLLVALPPAISYLLAAIRRQNPPRSVIQPTTESIVISCFPVVWFFAFLYYTELGSVLTVLVTVYAAMRGHHWAAGLVCLVPNSSRLNCEDSRPLSGGPRQLHFPPNQHHLGAIRVCDCLFA